MKRFSILNLALVTLVSTLIFAACGAQAAPPPTVNPVELQGTMAAAALTMIAETQAAIPTLTPIPPTATLTHTPAVTDTVPPLPPGVTLTPAANNDDCVNQALPETLHGETIKVRINNGTNVTMRVSLYLNQNGPQGQCGYRAFNLEPGQFIVMDDLVEGCYTLFAWNIDPDKYFIVNNGTDCLDNSSAWIFDISTGDIRLRT
jgi:hypothetical protein